MALTDTGLLESMDLPVGAAVGLLGIVTGWLDQAAEVLDLLGVAACLALLESR
jgi:hypothetical protein